MKLQNYTANSCPCSLGGCSSLWPCTPTKLCESLDPRSDVDAPSAEDDDGLTYLVFLAFNSSLVRNSFRNHPSRARDREVNRVLWLAHTARRVNTQLPIHAVVAGERLDATSEARLKRAGVRLLDGPLVPTPAWASKWHRLSFNKIAALSFTRFRKVAVLDNDVGLLQNMDHMLRTAPTPSAVFHTTIGPLAKRTRCAVTTGLLVLRPSTWGYARALATLQRMNYTTEQYDGGDEEFWLKYFSESPDEPLFELPWRYHAHRLLPMAGSEWESVRMMHLITALANRGWHIPKNATARVEHYAGISDTVVDG